VLFVLFILLSKIVYFNLLKWKSLFYVSTPPKEETAQVGRFLVWGNCVLFQSFQAQMVGKVLE
jgi:hypothetical protein